MARRSTARVVVARGDDLARARRGANYFSASIGARRARSNRARDARGARARRGRRLLAFRRVL